MPLQSLYRSQTLVERVYERILDAICEGALGPEEHITQDGLAGSLQVSRQPVMTASGQLKQQGFLVERGRRGPRIASLDPAKLEAIHEMRTAVEPFAAALAAARATESEVTAGRSIVERGRIATAADDFHESLLAEIAFHEWLYLASGNQVLAQSMQMHWPHVRRTKGELGRCHRYMHAAWSAHEAVLDAIDRGDTASAASGARAQLSRHRFRPSEGAEDRVGTTKPERTSLSACVF